MAKTKVIAWDRRSCSRCKRDRVHYSVQRGKWKCIGTLPEVRDVVASCGDPVKQPEELRAKAEV